MADSVLVEALYVNGNRMMIPVTVETFKNKVNIFHNDTLVQRYTIDDQDRIHGFYMDYDPKSGMKLSKIAYVNGNKHGISLTKRVIGEERSVIKEYYENGVLLKKSTNIDGTVIIRKEVDGKSIEVVKNNDGTVFSMGQYNGGRNGRFEHSEGPDGLVHYEIYKDDKLIEEGYDVRNIF